MIEIRRTPAPSQHVIGADFFPFLEAKISGPTKFQERCCLMMTATNAVDCCAVELVTIPTEWFPTKELAEARAEQVTRSLGLGVLYLPPEPQEHSVG